MDASKPFHTIILDAGPIIKNDPPISTLLAKSHQLLTLPSILLEIRDATTRARVETTLKPFLHFRDPKPESIKVIQDFARRTGDLQVLSRPDVAVLALAYEVECERNGGDWRLRKVPGQKGLNGSPPVKKVEESEVKEGEVAGETPDSQVLSETSGENEALTAQTDAEEKPEDVPVEESLSSRLETTTIEDEATHHDEVSEEPQPLTHVDEPSEEQQPSSHVDEPSEEQQPSQPDPSSLETSDPDLDSESDSEGWITPSNLSKHVAASSTTASTTTKPTATTLQVATLTSDFAMQNVLLLMNLNLLSPSLTRISNLKTYILRCHACFLQVKNLSKQFCPRCGQAALTRVSCSTDARTGEFKLYLKKNMQWNTRGDRYSIPKPTHGSANGKRDVGGGKGGWGNELVFSEDQKEYVRRVGEAKREKARDLMDEDYLPGILTGERARRDARPKVGAGRNVNSRKR